MHFTLNTQLLCAKRVESCFAYKISNQVTIFTYFSVHYTPRIPLSQRNGAHSNDLFGKKVDGMFVIMLKIELLAR